MASRIIISQKVRDARAETKKIQFNSLNLKGKINDVLVLDSYTIDTNIKSDALTKIASALTNKILEDGTIGKLDLKNAFDWILEIGFLPGVTDNIGTTTKETIEDLLKFKFSESVYFSQIFILSGNISRQEVETIGLTLHNPLIQRIRIKSYAEFVKEKDLEILVPKVNLKSEDAVIEVNLNVTDEELIKIGKGGVVDKNGISRGPLALDLAYMKAIQEYFRSKKRNPTDIELESIAQTWSEHCKHTIFADKLDEIDKGLYKTYIKEATNIIRKKKGKRDICVSVFSDNAGAIAFDDKYLVTHKVETHNSPSALDPFGGSITGIVGVNRDTIGFGLGAKPVANMYGFCLADPSDTRALFRDKNLTQKMLSPRRIMDGVIAGVNVGGNCSGIPTPHGFVYFDERFRGKPLVFVGTVGIIPRKIGKNFSTEKEAKKGDCIVVIGGKVGQDGIHGATFSSEVMDGASPATAVQIGDPITQKKLSDAIVKEARDLNLYSSITDNGAGGISCSIAEMAKECNGCKVELEKVPLKYPGLTPWKIWISESQERMTLAVPKSKWKAFKKLMDMRGVGADVVGEFTNSGKCVVTYHGKKIVDMDLEFLHNGLPSRNLVSKDEKITYLEAPKQTSKDLTKIVKDMLKRLNITSFEFISKQYDHEVQANSILKPLQGRGQVNADVAVIRPVLDSKKGVLLSSTLNPSYSEIDSYKMAASSIDGAIRSVIAAGGDIENLAILDNFCWCSSTDPVRLGQLKSAVKACFDYAVAFGTPFISGKDSMFNDFKGYDEKGNLINISIPPTLLISSIGVMNDAEKAISLDFKFEGDLVYVLGGTLEELGGSEYFKYVSEKTKKEFIGNIVPSVDAVKNMKLYKAFTKCANKELVASSISIGRGGLAVALAKSSIGGKLGAEIELKKISKKTSGDDRALFSESQGRILVSINPKNKKTFEDIMKGNSFTQIGKVSKDSKFIIKGRDGNEIVNAGIDALLTDYKSTFKNF
ncbi:MAG: Phosphoribosylformylglycinamidine synthase [Candidatus Taylorbacteria bacterium]|nr:Phosphoribosylformylglycinamidine synthase [Candidatus Taylorbacteria bacterium]